MKIFRLLPMQVTPSCPRQYRKMAMLQLILQQCIDSGLALSASRASREQHWIGAFFYFSPALQECKVYKYLKNTENIGCKGSNAMFLTASNTGTLAAEPKICRRRCQTSYHHSTCCTCNSQHVSTMLLTACLTRCNTNYLVVRAPERQPLTAQKDAGAHYD